jgi:hypothetical protein
LKKKSNNDNKGLYFIIKGDNMDERITSVKKNVQNIVRNKNKIINKRLTLQKKGEAE